MTEADHLLDLLDRTGSDHRRRAPRPSAGPVTNVAGHHIRLGEDMRRTYDVPERGDEGLFAPGGHRPTLCGPTSPAPQMCVRIRLETQQHADNRVSLRAA